MSLRKMAILTGLLAPLCAHAAPLDARPRRTASVERPWLIAGGTVGIRWNVEILDGFGLDPEPDPSGLLPRTDRGDHAWFALDGGTSLQLDVVNDTVRSFGGGSLQTTGGYVLHLRDGSRIDLRGMRIRPRAGANKVFDVVDGNGDAWFKLDHPMYDLFKDTRTLRMYSADLRMTRALAKRIGAPLAADQFVGEITLTSTVTSVGSNPLPAGTCSPFPWPGVAVPGVPGANYQLDVFMQMFPTIDVVGCGMSDETGHCDGPGGDDGIVSYAPSTQLKDNVNNGTPQATVPGDPLGMSTALYAATVPWYRMFNPDQVPPNSPQPPYDNDQHAWLVWNLYRFNGDGSLEQIGRSGLKHAYHANTGGACLDECNSSHALGRGCEDQYSTGDNDDPLNMGPRSELVPATGVWGRCGSIWDSACTGNQQPADPPADPYGNGNDTWTRRMKTRESQLDPAAHPGATYLIEAWYVSRDDINIYNSMATSRITPTWVEGSPGAWLPLNPTNFLLGPAIDRWVSPGNPSASAKNTEIASGEGHAKVAVKVVDLGNGQWRYDYAVMNLDFSRAVVQAPEHGPDPRVLSAEGFDSFSIPLPSAATVSTTDFRDDANTQDTPWTATVADNGVTWNSTGTTLDWGSLYGFSVTTNLAPGNGNIVLHVAQMGDPASYSIATLVPGGASDVIFRDGFDVPPANGAKAHRRSR